MTDEEQAKSHWKSVLRDSDKLRQQWIDSLRNSIKEVSEDQKGTLLQPETKRKYRTKTKLVKLSDVITTMHLIHAEVVLHVLPNEIKKGVDNIRVNLEKGAATWVAVKFIAKEVIAKSVVEFFSSIYSFFSAIQDDADLEDRMRAVGEDARNSLVADSQLRQKKERGRVRDVRTRHKTPKHKRHYRGCKSL